MVDNVQPRSFSCFRIRKRRHENRMDLRRANTPEPLNRTWAGERSEYSCSFQSPGLSFLLTLPFIERANRTSLTMSALSNTFLGTLLPSLKGVFYSASFVVFLIGPDKHGSFVI